MRELQLHTRAAQRSRSWEEIHMSETTKAAAWAVFQHHGGGGSAAGAATSSSYSRGGGGGSGIAAVGRATRFKVVLETTSSSSSSFSSPHLSAWTPPPPPCICCHHKLQQSWGAVPTAGLCHCTCSWQKMVSDNLWMCCCCWLYVLCVCRSKRRWETAELIQKVAVRPQWPVCAPRWTTCSGTRGAPSSTLMSLTPCPNNSTKLSSGILLPGTLVDWKLQLLLPPSRNCLLLLLLPHVF